MWNGLGEAIPLQLTINSQIQEVGKAPVFTLIGAPPGAQVLWSSFKDGVETAEFNAGYGQLVESNGTAKLTGGNWTDNDLGVWSKQVLVQDADGRNYRGMVNFRVVPAAAASPVPSPTPASGGDWLSTPLFEVAGVEVTPVIAGLGIVGLYFLTKKK